MLVWAVGMRGLREGPRRASGRCAMRCAVVLGAHDNCCSKSIHTQAGSHSLGGSLNRQLRCELKERSPADALDKHGCKGDDSSYTALCRSVWCVIHAREGL